MSLPATACGRGQNTEKHQRQRARSGRSPGRMRGIDNRGAGAAGPPKPTYPYQTIHAHGGVRVSWRRVAQLVASIGSALLLIGAFVTMAAARPPSTGNPPARGA